MRETIIEWNVTTVSILSASTTTIGSGFPVLLHSVYVNQGSNGKRIILKDGTAIKHRIPASSTDGNCYVFGGDNGVRYDTSLVIDPNSSSGEIAVHWKDLARP